MRVGRCDIAIIIHSSAGGSWTWKDAAVGLAAGTAAIAATPLVLSAAGFTAAGIAAGSLAAGIQSVVYGGAAGGAFAAVQSAGVAGIGYTATAVIGGTAGSAAVLAKKVGEKWFSSGKD